MYACHLCMACAQAESGSKLAAMGAAVMCRQAPAYRSGAALHVHYTREHVAELIQKVGLGTLWFRTLAH